MVAEQGTDVLPWLEALFLQENVRDGSPALASLCTLVMDVRKNSHRPPALLPPTHLGCASGADPQFLIIHSQVLKEPLLFLFSFDVLST